MSRPRPEEQLDRLIDQLIDPSTEGKPVPLAGSGPQGGDIYALISLAERVRDTLQVPGPDPTFVHNTKLRILNQIRAQAEDEVRRAEQPRRHWLLRPSWGAALAALGLIAVLVFSSLGVGVAAARESLPGESLYPLKRGFEETRLILSLDAQTDAQLLAEFSDERLQEIEELLQAGRADDLERATAAYEQSIDRLARAAGTGLGASRALLDERISSHIETLERVRDQVPPQAQPAIQRAIDRSLEHAQKKQEQREKPEGSRKNNQERENPAETREIEKDQRRAEQIARQYDVPVGEVMDVFDGECGGDWKCVRDHYRLSGKE